MNEIRNWIENFYNKKAPYISVDSCLFIIGNSGIGKTYNINKLCKDELDLFVINIDSISCSSSIQLQDIIIKSITSSLIQLLTNNNKKKIILIDDFDILISLDSTINITLLNILTKNNLKNIPIICISSLELIKKIGDIKKKCKIIEFNSPNLKEIRDIILNIDKYKNININILNNIIEKSNYNISQCFKQLENSSNDIYYNIDIIQNIDYLYNNEFDRNKIKKILVNDQWLIPLNFHENIVLELENKKINKQIKNSIYKNYINNFCFFDILMYNNNNELALDYFISIIYPIIILPLKKNKKDVNNNFTKILSYLSLQKKFLKYTYNNNYPVNQIGNYHINLINRKFIYYN